MEPVPRSAVSWPVFLISFPVLQPSFKSQHFQEDLIAYFAKIISSFILTSIW